MKRAHPPISMEALAAAVPPTGVSDELRALAAGSAERQAREAAFVDDHDAVYRALIAALRPLAGIPLRLVLAEAERRGLRDDAFPDLLELLEPPRRSPELVVAVALAAAQRLAEVAATALDEANEIVATFAPVRREE